MNELQYVLDAMLEFVSSSVAKVVNHMIIKMSSALSLSTL